MTSALHHAIEAGRDKKAGDIVVLDLRGRCDFADFFLICHGSSDRQVVAISDAIEERLAKEAGLKPSHVEGRRQGEWILLDYIDLVVHVFLEDRRRFYGLERLWGDAPRVALDEPVDSGPKAARRAIRRPRSASQ